jgi:predicted permease
MTLIAALRRAAMRLLHALQPGRRESDLARELHAHLTLLEDDFRRRGLSPEEARLAARRALGGVEQVKELHRGARSFVWLDDARRDAWQMLRSLNRNRGFATAAILTLTIGIGANTALFSAFNAIVLRPLPYHEPDRIVFITPPVFAVTSPKTIRALQEHARQIRTIAGFIGPGAGTLLAGGSPASVDYADVTWNFPAFLGTPPAIGREFTEADGQPGATRVAMLTYRFWQLHFGGAASVIGQTLVLNNTPVTIVGVTSPAFRFPVTGARPSAGIAEDLQPGLLRVASASIWMNVLGRLAPGATVAGASAELLPIYRDVELNGVSQSLRDSARVEVVLLHEQLAAALRPWLLLVMGTVALVLLVSSANVANLLLARASTRQREVAVRAAIGAARSRLIRMALTESLVLAAVGGLLALVLTSWTGTAVRQLLADRMPHVDEIGIDWPVFAFNAALTTVIGLVCGVASVSGVRRLDIAAAFGDGSTRTVSSKTRARQCLLSVEAGLTFVLVLGALLVAQTFRNLESKERGFDTRDVLTLRLSPGPGWRAGAADAPTAAAALATYLGRLSERMSTVPGASSVAFASAGPLAPSGPGFSGVTVKGLPAPAHQDVSVLSVTPHYFDTLRTPLVGGREFTESDTSASEPVVIVNQALQRRFAAGRSLVDATLLINNHELTIVGVASDMPGNTLRDEIQPVMYVPVSQLGRLGVMTAQMTMMVRAQGVRAAGIANGVRRSIWAFDSSAVVADVTTLEDRVDTSLRTERQSAVILSTLALIALLIAAIGVYGVATYAVTQRTRELGIRVALGAEQRDIVRLVLGQSVLPTIAGILAGVPLAFGGAQLLTSMLYGVDALDVPSFLGAAATLTLVAVTATITPTRRVLRLDPVEALRSE